jgi:cyanate permease
MRDSYAGARVKCRNIGWPRLFAKQAIRCNTLPRPACNCDRQENAVLQSDTGVEAAGPNDSRAPRMGAIAWLSHNVIIGSIFGTAGVLLIPLEDRLHVSRGLASIGVPMVMVGSAILASVAGVLAARYSLRRLMAVSGILMALAWLILAFAHSYSLFLLAYALFLGPAMSIGGAVLPPTLVTRWFQRHRGLAIGIVHLPIVITIMPLAASLVIDRFGVTALFLALALFAAVTLIPGSLALIEYPPGHDPRHAKEIAAERIARGAPAEQPHFTVPQLLQNPRFWLLALAVGAANTSSVTLGTHLPAMGAAWGYTSTSAAALASVMSLVGMAGSIIFGLVADKIGGARTLALIAFDDAILWSLLLMDLPYAERAVVIGLIGMHGAGAIPAISKAMATSFGEASFSRAFGLASTATLPLMVAAVFGFGVIFQTQGSYAAGMVALIAYFVIVIPLAIVAGRRTPMPPGVPDHV